MDTRIKELDEFLERVVAIQQEVDKQSTVKRAMWYQQPGDRYWTNRLGRIEPINEFDTETWQFQVNVEMRYHAGKFTEGADTDLEIAIQRFIMLALVIFKARQGLESKKFPDYMDALEIGNITISSRGVGTIPTGQTSLAKGSIFDLQVNITLSTEDF